MLRNPWKDEIHGKKNKKKKKKEEDEATVSSGGYEIVEEEVIETLSDYGDDLALAGEAEVEIEIEEELIDEQQSEISERNGGEEDDESEYEERSVYTEFESMNNSGFMSLTEVEVDDADADAIYETILSNDILADEMEEFTIREDSDVEEVTYREDDDELRLLEKQFNSNVQVAQANDPSDGTTKPPEKTASSGCDTEEEDEDPASAEEFREAIDYVLRQERAVAKMILTEEQAKAMMNLPAKLMKIIVDHMEICDNNDSPIDWDFLLKIVMPFCKDGGADDDSSRSDEE